MGALKPWHLLVAVLCCLLPFAAAVGGTVWLVLRRQGSKK
jgi:hypothetical protein